MFLQARRRVEDDLESIQTRIAGFVDVGGRPRDMVEKVAVFTRELEGVRKQAVELRDEEIKLDGHSTGALVALVSDQSLLLLRKSSSLYKSATSSVVFS